MRIVQSKWKEIQIRLFNFREKCYCVEGWKTIDPKESSVVIAKIFMDDLSVQYLDQEAIRDSLAQKSIHDFVNNINSSKEKQSKSSRNNVSDGSKIF